MTFRNRLSLTFGMFTVVICLLFAALFLESLNFVEEALVGSLLEQQAEVLQEDYRRDPASLSLPDLEQLKGYLSGEDSTPESLSRFAPGYYDSQELQLLVVELEPERFLYLVYDERTGVLDSNEVEIHLAIAGMVGVVMLVGFALAWSQGRRLSAPLVRLASEMTAGETSAIDPELQERQDEIGLLSRSYAEQMERIEAFIAREQAFTRHVSHELSTPLAIIRSNLELMREPRADVEMQQKSVARMEQAIARMQRQIGIFLVLAREEQLRGTSDAVDFERVLDELLGDHPQVALEKDVVAWPVLHVDADLLHTVLQNMLSNLESHGQLTEGRYRATFRVDANMCCLQNRVEDRLRESQTRGGFGLQINRKLCVAAGWRFEHEIVGEVFTARIHFG
ncbi:MAG: HAMP domain-containing sensor histidine kinase [Myxococcota bacterium]